MAGNIDSSEFWKVGGDGGISSYFLCNVCRLCASISDNVVPIFDDKVNEKESIHAKLKKCLPSILVLENDVKPKQICSSCVSKLDLCVSFIDMSHEADCRFETLLQIKSEPVTNSNAHVVNGRTLVTTQEPQEIAQSDKCQGHFDFSSTELLNQLYQQRNAFSQHVISTPVSISTSQNIPSNETQQGISHSILQNLLTQDTVPHQDVVLLLEVKCKDLVTTSSSAVTNKKTETLQNPILPSVKMTAVHETANLTNQQTRIVDTSGHIRVINLADFDGKFNQFDKIASSFINADSGVLLEKSLSPSNSIVPLLKNVDPDLLNMLKFDNLCVENAEVADTSKPSSTMSPITSSIPANMMLDTTKQNGLTARQFDCGVCGKQFTRKNRLNAHVARHSSERPHSCDKCDQRFITRWDLTLHLRIHSGVFSCEFCGKAFPAKGKLDRHRRTHTGERPFPCPLCSRAFSEKRNLRNHLKTHANIAATEARKNSNSCNCTVCGCWLSSDSNESTDGMCDSCSGQNHLSVADAPNVSEIEEILAD